MSGPYKKVEPGAMQLHGTTTTGVTTGNGGVLLCKGDSHLITVILESTGATSGGTISIEEAFYRHVAGEPDYAGTWSVIQSISASTFSGGAQVVVHVLGASVYALRARISSDITGGGSIRAWAWGN